MAELGRLLMYEASRDWLVSYYFVNAFPFYALGKIIYVHSKL